MTAGQLALLLGLSLSLLLTFRSLGSDRESFSQNAKMALIWALLIAGLALIITRFI